MARPARLRRRRLAAEPAPRPLVHDGYRTPAETAHDPQGLLRWLYPLRARLPVDFDLHAHGDERRAARAHLSALRPRAGVVYDRGDSSFGLLHTHLERGLHAVFRLQSHANSLFRDFIQSDRSEALLTVPPSDEARRQSPPGALRPCRVRLVQYTHGSTESGLGATLRDRQRSSVRDLADLDHARWGIEDLYKTSKPGLRVEWFHGRSERLVKQELYAHFTLIALTRLFANHSEQGLRTVPDGHGRPTRQVHFQNSLRTVARQLEGLFLQHASVLSESVQRVLEGIAACWQRRRPGRSFPRLSRKPASKWRNRKATAMASHS